MTLLAFQKSQTADSTWPRVLSKKCERISGFTFSFIYMLESLYSSQTRTYAVTVSQIIDLETDKGKNCMDYPNTNYSSYRECDENFVYNEVEKNYNIMPFWAAKNIDAITHIAYYIQETF